MHHDLINIKVMREQAMHDAENSAWEDAK